ncbi:MAG: cytochrome c [Motiliproteus sp.]|jgi:cytochrome c
MKAISMIAVSGLLAASAVVSAESMEAAAGKSVFNHNCEACHSEDSSKNTFGPTLTGVVGRKAASLPRFAYSEALKDSAIVWSEGNLRKWVVNNEKLVPGTRMRHVSITDTAEQNYLIAYLETLK